jgi:CheY-like chemotaxis protein
MSILTVRANGQIVADNSSTGVVGVPNVLIIEADFIVRNLLIGVLSRQGFTVYEASNPQEALELCKSIAGKPLALLIADHETVESAVTDQILAACADTQVLHISGRPLDLVQQDGALVPGSSFLKKPFTHAELLHSIQQLLYPRTQ